MSVYPEAPVETFHFLPSQIPVQIAGAYTAGDVVGGALSADFSNKGSNIGWLETLFLHDINDEATNITVYVFEGTPAAILDDAAMAISETDAPKLLYVWAITTWTATLSRNYKEVTGLHLPFDMRRGLTFYIVDASGVTFTEVESFELLARVARR